MSARSARAARDRVVVDPIDGSVNAKRGIPFFSFSLAVAEGGTMDDVGFGYVYDFGTGEEWTAERGRGAFLDGEPLEAPPPKETVEILSFEGTTTQAIAERGSTASRRSPGRIRVMGSLALSLCHLAAGRVDAVCSLKEARSVDIAAAQLLVRERGLAIELVDDPPFAAAPLDLVTRSRVVAAGSDALVAAVAGALRVASARRRTPTRRAADRSPSPVALQRRKRIRPARFVLKTGVTETPSGRFCVGRSERAVVRLHAGNRRAEREAGVRRERAARRCAPARRERRCPRAEASRPSPRPTRSRRARAPARGTMPVRSPPAATPSIVPGGPCGPAGPRGTWPALKSRASSE